MTALNFPDSPSNGDTYQGYTYNSTKTAWAKPAASATTVVANVAALPTSAAVGDQAFVTATNRLYLWNGTGWYNIALINTTPSISGVNATYDLAINGTATTVTITAADPEGLPITYSIASDTSGNTATVVQGTGANTNVFTITPSTNEAHAGTFSLTFRASDGINIASAAASFTLQFSVVNSRYTSVLITPVGADNATNASFDDKSTSNNTITKYGEAHQTTFSPYRHSGYAQHFTNDRISYANHSSLQIGTQDFSMEAWIKLRTQGVNYERFITQQASWAQGGVKGVEFATEQTGTPQLNIMIDGSSATDFGHAHNIDKERWYHAVITRESGHARIFIDGVMKNNAANTTNINGSGGTHFGTNTAGTDQMDDFLIRDFRLCIGGVPTDYSTTSTTNDATIFSVPDAHITKTSQGATASEVKALLFNTPYLQDNSDNTDASLTLHSVGRLAPDGPYDNQEYSAGSHLGSVRFDGTGDYLASDNNDIGNFGTGDFNLEGWFWVPDRSALYTVVDGRPSSLTSASGWSVAISTAGTLYVYTGGFHITGTAGAVTTGQWHHWALSRESGAMKLFLNGKQQGNTNSTARDFTANLFRVGASGTGGEVFKGNQADVRVVKGTAVYTANFTPPTAPLSAITNTTFLLHNTDGGIIDKAQGARSILLQGDAKCSTDQTKFLTTSMKFDGNDRINIGVLNDNGGILAMRTADFTWEAWVYIGSGNTSYHQIFSSRPSNTGGTEQGSLAVNPSGGLTFYVGAFVIDYTTSIGTGSWKHIAVVRDGSNCRLFVDGTQVAINTSFTSDMSRDDFTLGANYNGTEGFTGYLSDVRVTKGLARYTSNFTPPTAALQG